MSQPEQPSSDSSAPAPQADSIADGTERSLDPAALKVSRLAGGITAAIFSGAATIGMLITVVVNRSAPLSVLFVFACWFLFCTGAFSLAWFWPPVRIRRTSYRVDPRGIRIRRGVIWRSETTVPRSRIQHTDVSRGPIERSFGLATLAVHTAGTENASVSLGGLASDIAYRIRDYLIETGPGDAV